MSFSYNTTGTYSGISSTSTPFFSSNNNIDFMKFPNQFLNNNTGIPLYNTNNINNININNTNSPLNSVNNITSRSSTPNSTSASSITTSNSNLSSPIIKPLPNLSNNSSNNSNNSINSNNNININNNLLKENLELKNKLSSLNLENISLKLEISKLKLNNNNNIINLYNNSLKDKEYYKNQYFKYQNDYNKLKKRKDELEKLVNEERAKKRKLVHIIYEFGMSNSTIRRTMGDFEYSAEIRKYAVAKCTKLRNDIKQFTQGVDHVGYKEVEFTNSSDLELNINDLKVIDENKQYVKFKIRKLGTSFGTVYEDDNDDNNSKSNYHNNNNGSSKSYNRTRGASSKNSSYYDCRSSNNNNIIRPDDHFLICFEHPIDQQIGSHTHSYRLFSRVKADTPRYKGNGAFGQKIEFTYNVVNYNYYH